MNVRYGNISGFKKCTILMVVCILLSIAFVASVPSVAAKEYLPPTYEYTNNFYKSYGEPDISASVLGDTELERGETATLKVVLANRGVIYGIKADQGVGTSEYDHELSLTELEYETQRTIAYGLKASLVSSIDMVDVDPETSSHTLEALYPGVLPEHPMEFTITLSEDIPAGVYVLELPLSYEYQSDVRMTSGEAIRLGKPDLDHASFYTNVETTLKIPIIVKPEAKFEITNVNGSLVSGGTSVVNVTYTNTGELTAEDAIARIIAMKPLSTTRSTKSLGTMEPGESRTATFIISSDTGTLAKSYGIDSEIKYIDEDGEDTFSSGTIINLPLEEPERQINVTGLALAGIFVIIVVLIVKSKRKNESDDN
ncbi:COG1361 S-layer family protein [Methanolobus bombayensis]|uniref:COG1361 S-layer family protein n=1 Tax=Methanolobus bombayensis TaxID=38023 RepID=UPI001AE41023|nr:hypothetical protein [Methanolobus bombayensis]MBP1908758.1 hypothetical protein [Methanolobus bombayensis]